jgi:hypothetical protein
MLLLRTGRLQKSASVRPTATARQRWNDENAAVFWQNDENLVISP